MKTRSNFWCHSVNNKHHTAERWNFEFEFRHQGKIPNSTFLQRRQKRNGCMNYTDVEFVFLFRMNKINGRLEIKSGHNLEHQSTYCLFSEQCLCNTAPIVTSLQRHLYGTTKTRSTLAHSSLVKSALTLQGLNTVLNTM